MNNDGSPDVLVENGGWTWTLYVFKNGSYEPASSDFPLWDGYFFIKDINGKKRLMSYANKPNAKGINGRNKTNL